MAKLDNIFYNPSNRTCCSEPAKELNLKWLIFSLVLAACGIAQPARTALALEFDQGIIVDPVRSVVYIMSPEQKIDAVNLLTGEVISTSTSGAKPLLLHNELLLAQTAEKDRAHVLGI